MIRSGELQVLKSSDGAEIEIATLKTNQLVGELSFIDKKPRSASVRANVPTEVLELSSVDISHILGLQPAWFRILVETLIGHIRSANEKLVR